MQNKPRMIELWTGESMLRGDEVRLLAARSILTVKAALRDSFPGGLVNDPVVELLMALFVAGMTGSPIPFGSACAASGVTPSVAKRWLLELQKQELIAISDDAEDKSVTLSAKGYRDMRHAIDAVLAAQEALLR